MTTGNGFPITTYFRVCDGVRVRYADTGTDSDTTMLLLAPWPESLWAFRRIWNLLSEAGRVVAIDMPGFGHSEGRPELIAPNAMGTFLEVLIEDWELGAPHIVGPDVGTAAALFLAASSPERLTSLTVGGGAVALPIEAGEDYVSAYDLGRFAESARFVRHYPEQNMALADLLPTISTPTQIVAGDADRLVPWSNNQYLDDRLPNSEAHKVDAGHYAWEQAPETYGRLIADWVSGGYRRLLPG